MQNPSYIQAQIEAAIESYKIAKSITGLDLLSYNTLCANIRYNAQVLIAAAQGHDELLNLRCEARKIFGMP